MDMDLFKKIIDDIAQNGIKWRELAYYNEPLLDPMLFERIKYAKSRGLKIHLNTNGTLLTQEKRKAILDSGLDVISVSLDAATAETYRKVRGSADFEKVKNNVIALIEERNRRFLNKPRIQVGFVFQKDNCHEVEEFRAFWKNLADKVAIWGLTTRTTRMKELVVKKFDLAKPRLRFFYPCHIVFKNPAVLSDGRVTPCCPDYDGLLSVGNFKHETFNQIWNSPKYREIRDTFLAGRGETIDICQKLRCGFLYHQAYFIWWRRF